MNKRHKTYTLTAKQLKTEHVNTELFQKTVENALRVSDADARVQVFTELDGSLAGIELYVTHDLDPQRAISALKALRIEEHESNAAEVTEAREAAENLKSRLSGLHEWTASVEERLRLLEGG
jgi:FtsZ-binding cell division protein ZapB